MRLLACLFLALALLPRPARADIAPPASSPCKDKVLGAACTANNGGAGTCQNATCSLYDLTGSPDIGHATTAPCLQCLDAHGETPPAPAAEGCTLAGMGGPSIAGIHLAAALVLLTWARRRL